ncbi:MAG: hypothetical protein COT25_01835 [Candidatus Kerfeldbacteria bacterium CG08_land_8_20_14_0_20_42_7]|uniref:Uncharacterized protein n=1 Tax=Candidatus Kerfeldbacteria bacterium CG08_land_8_20_14_0_20_42_7 TaxID=2014245 RepID=A0A2H0YT45_9BACT|nr:MAG: hypothetical protein COT25_01835 [Candidatus Kerfeldbacteria bacterium CG08_land_8_20_14_0_20_42_7]
MSDQMRALVVVALFVVAAILDHFLPGSKDVVTAALDPSEVVVGVAIISGIAYWILGDGTTKKIEPPKK